MNTIKAVRILHEFVDEYQREEVGDSGDNFIRLFDEYIKRHHIKEKNISFYLHVAIVKGFISVDEKEKTIGNAFNFSSSFSEYVIEADSKKNKFVYGLIGSIVTVIGGLIGALITSLL